LHCDKDTDGVIMLLRKAKEGQKILDIILAFLDSRHDFHDSLKFARKWLKMKFPEEFAKLSQLRASQARPFHPRASQPSQGGGERPSNRKRDPASSTRVSDSQRNAGLSRTPKKPRSGRRTPTDRATTGSGARTGTDAILAENWHAQQIKLFDTQGIRSETIIVDICNLYPLVREGHGLLGPYQVRLECPEVFSRTIDQCATRKEFQMDKKDKYKYYVIGENHFACAQLDLAKANLHLDSVRRTQAWIVARVSIQEARALAWRHNMDNEFRSSMTTIQWINYLHMRYLKNNWKVDMAFKMNCAGEIQLT
jgi:hypothetical protein